MTPIVRKDYGSRFSFDLKDAQDFKWKTYLDSDVCQ